MKFEWDEEKASRNFGKHKVSFEEAKTAFGDSMFGVFVDPDHSLSEQRFILMGESAKGRLLVVSFTNRGEAVRLISARRATPAERRFYEQET
jgi:uncharacterized DUF497 family protein